MAMLAHMQRKKFEISGVYTWLAPCRTVKDICFENNRLFFTSATVVQNAMWHTSLHAVGRSDGYERFLEILISVTCISCTGVHLKESFKFFITIGFNTEMFMANCHFFLILSVCSNSHCCMQDFIVRGLWIEGNVKYRLNCIEIFKGKSFLFNLKV
jgi:hypothetical protein